MMHSLRWLLLPGILALVLAMPIQAQPPGHYGPYATPASPLYPGYRPPTPGPSPFQSSGINHYTGYITGSNYAPGYEPGFASSYWRVSPTPRPPGVSTTRFYIPSEIESAAAERPAQLEVVVPPDAVLWFNDWKARSTGSVRTLQSTPLVPGRQYAYTVKARWTENGREVTRTRQVGVSAGASVRINFLDNADDSKK